MNTELAVLSALLRLARRRKGPSLDDLVVRVGQGEKPVRRALFSLAKSGLIQRTPAGLRLSLAGLAVAAAFAQRPLMGKRAKSLPLVAQAPQASSQSIRRNGTRAA